MAVEWTVAPQPVLEIARRILERHHEHLLGARIAFIMRSEAPETNGKVTYGKAKKVSAELQVHIPYDFIIWLARDRWISLSSLQREALIDHELSHCEWDGEMARIKGHDVEEFAHIIERYGFWWPSSDRVEMAVQHRLPLQPVEEPRQGNVGTIDFGRIAREAGEQMRADGFDVEVTHAAGYKARGIGMNIDIAKVNLTERDIEDWLYANPHDVDPGNYLGPIVCWFARQYKLPSGIADLIGYRRCGRLVVVEVKSVPINKAAITQVCRYSADLQQIAECRVDYPREFDGTTHIQRLLVGPSIDTQTFAEAMACDVHVVRYTASLELSLGSVGWSRDSKDKIDKECESISLRDEWNIYGQYYLDNINRVLMDDELSEEIDEIFGKPRNSPLLSNRLGTTEE